MGNVRIPDWVKNESDLGNNISWKWLKNARERDYQENLPSSPTPGDTVGLELSLTKSAVSYCPRGQSLEGGMALRH